MPSAILFDGTATPPVPGGDYACFKFIHTFLARVLLRTVCLSFHRKDFSDYRRHDRRTIDFIALPGQ